MTVTYHSTQVWHEAHGLSLRSRYKVGRWEPGVYRETCDEIYRTQIDNVVRASILLLL